MATDGGQFAKADLSIRDSSLKSWEKLLFAYLKDAIGSNREAWPSRETLAKWCSVSTKTITRAIATLETQGLLAVRRELTSKGHINHYSLPTKGLSVPAPYERPESRGLSGSQGTVSPYPRDCESLPQGTVSPCIQTKTEPDPMNQSPLPPDAIPQEVREATCAWAGRAMWGVVSRRARERVTRAVEDHGAEFVAEALNWASERGPRTRPLTAAMTRAAGKAIEAGKESNVKPNPAVPHHRRGQFGKKPYRSEDYRDKAVPTNNPPPGSGKAQD